MNITPSIPPSFPLVTPFWLHKLAHYRPIGASFWLIKRSFASAERNGLATPNEALAPGDATCYSAESSALRRGSAAMGQQWPSLADSWILLHQRGVIVREDKQMWSYVRLEQKDPSGGGRGWPVPPEKKNRKVKAGLYSPLRDT
ncbi:hypothetical protein Baya_1038 [Bagarius yarrelli]|uniref:Uncharacterized protein n=1 Tax=Bagarius yarrelli TaxID=175774 RepID=A0A556TJZ9_BAGYA|nr:hypothetical protein Baya_1038 [Bagarius yarrelli]